MAVSQLTSKSGLLYPELMKSIAGLATQILIPCLSVTTLGSRLSLDVLADVWPVVLFGLTNSIVAFMVGGLTAIPAKPPLHFRRAYLVSCTFNNVVAVPLVMLQTLCDRPQLSDEEDCFERASSFVFVHLFGFSLTFWTIGVAYLTGEAGTSYTWKQRAYRLLNPPFLAIVFGFFIALTPGVQDFLFGPDAALQFLSSAFATLGSAVVPIMTLLMAASLGHNLRRQGFFDWAARTWHRIKCCGKGKADTSKHQSETLDVFETDIDDIVLTTVGEDTEEPDFVDQVAVEQSSKEITEQELEPISQRTLAWLVISRTMVIPAINWTLVAFVADKLFQEGPDRDLAHLTLLIQSVTPTANLVIVVLQGAGLQRSAESVAQGVVVQYAVAILTLTVFTAFSVSFIYE